MKLAVIILTVIVSFSANCAAQSPKENAQNRNIQVSNIPDISDETYQKKLKIIEAERQNLTVEYQKSTDKKEILNKARQIFVTAIDQKIFPFWYGTDWDFYGTTEKPKEGKIACGYFVSTVLRDAGLRVSRVSMAQQASENIIKSLTDTAHIKRFHNTAIENFVNDVKNSGAGLYVVGLDVHVGFLLNDGNEVYFIHSSYVEPSEVIKEKALSSPILSSSKYRVIGKISADDQLMIKWLNQVLIPTIKR